MHCYFAHWAGFTKRSSKSLGRAWLCAGIFALAVTPTWATDFFWRSSNGGPFPLSGMWQPFDLINSVFGPGGSGDTVNFDLGVEPAARYTVTGVAGQNDRLLVHDDSLTMNFSGNYTLLSTNLGDPSFTVGVALGDMADVILTGSGVLWTEHSSIGHAWGSSGAVTVDGLQWIGNGGLRVGELGSGTLRITAGGSVSNTTGFIGNVTSGEVVVTGDGSTWTNSGQLDVGSGTMTIEAGGSVSNTDGAIGEGWNSEVTVTGAGSIWTNSGQLNVGSSGSGTLRIEAGGSVSNAGGAIGRLEGTSGEVTVTGAGSTWNNSGDLAVGTAHLGTISGGGMGTLRIEAGGSVTNVVGFLGSASAGSTGTVVVTGAGSTWTNSSELRVGNFGTGTLTIEAGGSVSNTFGVIGRFAGSMGEVTVTGIGSTWTNSGGLVLGNLGSGALRIEAGGSVSSPGSTIAQFTDSTGTVIVTGEDATWTNNGELRVGSGGAGTLTIEAGGSVSNTIGFIGNGSSSTGAVTVTGAGSTWNNSGELSVGDSGAGTLNVEENGRVAVGGNLTLAHQSGSTGIVNLAGGTLDMEGNGIVFGAGTAAFNFTGGTLRGVGTFGSALHQQGGRLEIGASPGTTTISGDYSAAGDATLAIELGGLEPGTQHDQFIITGSAASVGGTLDVSLIDGFAPVAGDTFEILSATGGVNGTFDDFLLPSLDSGLLWDVSYSPNDVLLSVVPGFTADFNNDGDVDAADLAIWETSFGNNPLADADGDGISDGHDFLTWQRQFGSGIGALSASEAVPEPSSLALMAMGAAGLWQCRRRGTTAQRAKTSERKGHASFAEQRNASAAGRPAAVNRFLHRRFRQQAHPFRR